MSKMFKPAQVQPLPPGDPLTATYLNARREWDERVGDAIARERKWIAIAFVCALSLGASAAGNVYQGTQSKVQTVHIVHDSLGAVISVNASRDPSGGPTQAMIGKSLTDWITDIRTVYTDAKALRDGITRAYILISGGTQAEAFINGFFQAKDPFKLATTSMVSVYQPVAVPPPPATIGPGQEQTWRLEWVEVTTGRDGVVRGQMPWSATITVTRSEPKDVDDARQNPNGLHIKSISWTPR